MGDLGFQGGFETMKAGKDVDGWLGVVRLQTLIELEPFFYLR